MEKEPLVMQLSGRETQGQGSSHVGGCLDTLFPLLLLLLNQQVNYKFKGGKFKSVRGRDQLRIQWSGRN